MNKSSTGWCFRNARGHFVMVETTLLYGNCSIVEGESLALFQAMKALTQSGISNVIFETDFKSVVDAITHFRGGSSEFSSLISHITNILSCNPNFTVKFIKRQANMIAHILARTAVSWPRRYTFESLLLCITTLLNNEMI
ncbi:uncharacterized protein LOC123886715 [Trifolium pratense]|uniref:uncharacterized protein LOC123886715 n=1 Tax=Trifolium pratense TaxID=57577 RepID=UPI001E690CE1|nr:uncharacterized protein LOC123886715 [Trifolium pratense]